MSVTTRTGPVLGRLPALDGLRGVAALAVVLTHVGFQTGWTVRGLPGALVGRMDLGVAVFFALSGFLLHQPWARGRATGGQPPDTVTYLVRRAARVLPAYWLVLVVVGIASRPAADVFATNALLAQVYLPGSLLDGYTQTWSLATEVSFYLLLPVIAAVVGRAGRPALAVGLMVPAGWCFAAVSGLVPIGGETLATRWLPAHLAWFAVGMLLAEATSGPPARWTAGLRELARHPGTCLAAAGGCFLLAATTVAGPLTLGPVSGLQNAVKEVLGTLVAGLLLLPLVLGDGRPGWGSWLARPFARWLGRISYGVFLWHLPVLEAFYALTGWPLFSGRVVVVLMVVLPVTLALASLTYVVVERPLLRRTARLATRRLPVADSSGGHQQQSREHQQA